MQVEPVDLSVKSNNSSTQYLDYRGTETAGLDLRVPDKRGTYYQFEKPLPKFRENWNFVNLAIYF